MNQLSESTTVKKPARKSKKEAEEPNGWDFEIDIDSETQPPKKESKAEEKPVIKKAKGPAKLSTLPKAGEAAKAKASTKQTIDWDQFNAEAKKEETESKEKKVNKNPFAKDKKPATSTIDDFFNET